MRLGFTSTCAVGLALALTIGYATTSQAQQDTTRRRTTRSSRRIPITKERSTSRGEVTPPAPTPNQDSIAAAERARQDSIAAAERARQDSVARADQMRRDSIAAVERRRADSIAAVERARQDSIARADSIAAAEAARLRMIRWAGGFTWGLGGGLSMPTGDVSSAVGSSAGYSNGWNVTMPFGWDFTGNPFGIRFDVGYDRWKGNNYTNASGQRIDSPDVLLLSGNADVKLRVPLGRSWSRFYVVGGVGGNHFWGYSQNYATGGDTRSFSDAKTTLGWNAGGGLKFAWGRTGLFLESRYMSATTPAGFPGVSTAKWVPVILGIEF